jgi:Ca2+-binding RTX toxin-like protein
MLITAIFSLSLYSEFEQQGVANMNIANTNKVFVLNSEPSFAFAAPMSVSLMQAPPSVLVGLNVTAVELNAMIANAAAGTIFVLQNGVHNFDAPLVINRSDITLKGESQAGTNLHFSFAAGTEADAIQVNGGVKTLQTSVTANIAVGQTSIKVADAHGLVAGGAIYISEPNTQAYLTANGWTNVTMADAATHPFREYIAEIDHIVGNTVYLKTGIPYAMDAGVTQVSNINLLHNVNLSDFTVTNNLPTANPYDFVNPLPAYDSLSAVHITGVSGGSISNVSVLNAASIGISLQSSINFTGHNLLVDGAVNKGGDGNGYGLLLSEAFNNHFDGLTLLNGRHGFILSAWSAETGNIVQIDNTNRDVNFHGSPDAGNVITVNHAVLDYKPALDTSGFVDIWPLVSHGGTNHASTNIYSNNQVTFHYAVGSSAADDFRGTIGNDYLNGGAGADIIKAGAGNDYIVGGLGKDVLTGGTGQDTFLLRVGDNLDRITDFVFGPQGDALIFANNPAVHAMADLTITQSGTDVSIRYGLNATVLLSNHTLADVQAANFQFDSAGTQTLAAWNGDYIL